MTEILFDSICLYRLMISSGLLGRFLEMKRAIIHVMWPRSLHEIVYHTGLVGSVGLINSLDLLNSCFMIFQSLAMIQKGFTTASS